MILKIYHKIFAKKLPKTIQIQLAKFKKHNLTENRFEILVLLKVLEKELKRFTVLNEDINVAGFSIERRTGYPYNPQKYNSNGGL